jgi:hypothetical protein
MARGLTPCGPATSAFGAEWYVLSQKGDAIVGDS